LHIAFFLRKRDGHHARFLPGGNKTGMSHFAAPMEGTMNRMKSILLMSAAAFGIFAAPVLASPNGFTPFSSQPSTDKTNTPPGNQTQGAPNGVITSLPNSDENYLDDKLLWSGDIQALSYPDGKTSYCVPAETRLLGRQSKFDNLTFPSATQTTSGEKTDGTDTASNSNAGSGAASGDSGAADSSGAISAASATGNSNSGAAAHHGKHKAKPGTGAASGTPSQGSSDQDQAKPGDSTQQTGSASVSSSKPYLPVVLDPKGKWFGFGDPQQSMTCTRDPWGKPYAVRFFGGKGVAVGPDDSFRRKTNTDDGSIVAIDPAGQAHALDPFGNIDPGAMSKQPDPSKLKDVEVSAALPPGQMVYIEGDVAGRADYRAGFDYGILAVPFKVQMTGKQAFSSSATLGAYIGYRIPVTDLGLEISPVFFAGASNITVPTAPGSANATETAAGFSYGGGFVTRVKDSVQVGLIVGFDHVDSATPYAYNDKPWLSLEIGYSFAQ
jgi:hypothetical protein